MYKTKTFLDRVEGKDCMVDSEDDQENTGSQSPSNLCTKHDKVSEKKPNDGSKQ